MRAILTYHSIDDSGSPISVSPAEFARHVKWLASGRVTVTTVGELLRMPDSSDAVAITFDDGFRNFAEVAGPLLERHALPSTLFVVPDHVGGTNAWGRARERGIPELPLLGWSEIAEWAKRGVAIGAHTRSHRDLAALTEGEIGDEVAGSGAVLAGRLGVAPAGFAYPYGRFTPFAAESAVAAFPWACTTELRELADGDERARLPRLDMYYFRQQGMLERWGTPRFRYYLSLRSHARRWRQRWSGSHAA